MSMTYKQIEAAREARLWIGQIIVPVAIVLSIPEVRQAVKAKAEDITTKLKKKKFKVVETEEP